MKSLLNILLIIVFIPPPFSTSGNHGDDIGCISHEPAAVFECDNQLLRQQFLRQNPPLAIAGYYGGANRRKFAPMGAAQRFVIVRDSPVGGIGQGQCTVVKTEGQLTDCAPGLQTEELAPPVATDPMAESEAPEMVTPPTEMPAGDGA